MTRPSTRRGIPHRNEIETNKGRGGACPYLPTSCLSYHARHPRRCQWWWCGSAWLVAPDLAGGWVVLGLDCLVTFVCMVSRHMATSADWVCVVLATVDFMGWLMRRWSTRWHRLVQVDVAGNVVAEIHVVSMQKKKNAGAPCMPALSLCLRPPSPHASRSIVFLTCCTCVLLWHRVRVVVNQPRVT